MNQQFAQFNFGEDLVAMILDHLIKTGRLKGYDFQKSLMVEVPIDEFRDCTVKANEEMTELNYSVNGQHKLDIAFKMPLRTHPIEVKLGTTLRCAKFPSTFHKFLKGEIKFTKANKSLAGNMINILERRQTIDFKDLFLKAGSDLDRSWSLVTRDVVVDKSSIDRSQFRNLRYVFTLESLWQQVEDEAIRKQITSNLTRILNDQLGMIPKVTLPKS